MNIMVVRRVLRAAADAPCHPIAGFIARHNDVVGLNLWNGAKPEKKSACGCLKLGCGHTYDENARPLNGWRRVTTARLYQPIGGIEIGYVSDRWDDSDDRVDAALERLFCNSRNVPGTGDAVTDAFLRMHGWGRFLPGLVKDGDTPHAAALRCGFWIRRCDQMRDKGWQADSLDILRAFHPAQRVLQRKAPPRLRIVTADDIAAAYLVIQHATMASLGSVAKKQRWKDGAFTGDRTIIGLMLDEGLSAPDIAGQLGMSPSMVARRLKAVIKAIAKTVPALSSRNAKFAPRVGKLWPDKRTDKPQLWTRPPRPRLETRDKFRSVAMPMAFERPGITDPGRPKQWGGGSLSRRIKLTPMDTLWAIAGYLAKSNINRLPSGCAEDYPPETSRRFDWVIKASVDVSDDAIDGDTATSNSAGLFIPHWHNLRPRAADWRKIARKLPAELRSGRLSKRALLPARWRTAPHRPMHRRPLSSADLQRRTSIGCKAFGRAKRKTARPPMAT